ncbi:MAG: ABC transporter permease [Dysgonamonadaceae bacterium]|jgi:lipopolysaccharide transport system permease protein|nr:ABC transporter permease [Dysgonamonadaceae bacterium]
MIETEKWTMVIKPKTGLFDIDFKELIRYRDLWQMFVKRDIVTQYKQTILGPLWFFVNPALTTIMYMVVFGKIAKIPTDGLPQPLFYLSGICLWNYFSTCLLKTSATFRDNEGIFGKVYFPRLVMPLSTVTSSLYTLGIQLILFLLIYAYYIITGVSVAPNIYILLTPFLIVILAGISLGFGIITSSLTTKYRDLSILFSFIVQLWMYATPIIYPLSMMSPNKQWIAALNPVTSIIETFRYATLGTGTFDRMQLGYSFVFMCIVLGLGIVVFNKVQRSFMDTV